jgi:hypothetical protein
MAISFCLAFSLTFSSKSFFVKFPMVSSWIFISWYLGRMMAPVAGFDFAISLSMVVSQFGSLISPVFSLYSTSFALVRSVRISFRLSIGISSFLASCLMLTVFCSSISDSMSAVLSMVLSVLLAVFNY